MRSATPLQAFHEMIQLIFSFGFHSSVIILQQGRGSLNSGTNTTLWSQGWISADELELAKNQTHVWNQYIEELRHRAHIRLIDYLDELAWTWKGNDTIYKATKYGP